jgi:hypothetical protein
MENPVGRITGWDVQDGSALIVRTIFYQQVIDKLGNWKNTATVQTGTGTDAQRIPVVDFMRRILGIPEDGLPIKWPTGESHYENVALSELLGSGDFNVLSTENLQSMRVGFTTEVLREINRAGILNLLFFPKMWVNLAASSDDIQGGQNQENSNFIFSFAHGQPMSFTHGDVLIDSMGFALPGFPGIIHQLLSRWLPHGIASFLPAGLSSRGGYSIRAVENMELGPSVMIVESCYVGRIDGLYPQNAISQAYLHAGVNTFIASTRGSPGPGYLVDYRTRPVGLGLKEYIEASRIAREGEYPDLHFTPLQVEAFYEDLINGNSDVGTAFRNGRNEYLPADANTTLFWSPPLALQINTQYDLEHYLNNIRETARNGEGSKVLEKKYVNLFEYNLYGDPAFNPFEPCNEGS